MGNNNTLHNLHRPPIPLMSLPELILTSGGLVVTGGEGTLAGNGRIDHMTSLNVLHNEFENSEFLRLQNPS